jgi:hypothetical protein
MATYKAWNQGIIEYTLAGAPPGSAVYLSIDDDALAAVASRFLPTPPPTHPVEDFLDAVSEQAGLADEQGHHLRLHRFEGEEDGVPLGVGFLAAQVLAAYRMEDTDPPNLYFPLFARLFAAKVGPDEDGRHVLGMDYVGGWPPEVSLWRRWNRWLTAHGYEETAEEGGGGSIYTHYPISQTVLRRRDREQLAALLRSAFGREPAMDRDGLALRLGELAVRATGRLLSERLACEDSEPRRFEAVADAAFDVYRTIRSEGDVAATDCLSAGLYRCEGADGEPCYYAYPRALRHWSVGEAAVIYPDVTREPLRLERPGWFRPLARPLEHLRAQSWPLDGQTRGASRLELVRRTFWILVEDPDVDYSDDRATWRLPEAGEPFTLLCLARHKDWIDRVRGQGLLRASDPITLALGDETWLEYGQCSVARLEWDGVVANACDAALLGALRPRRARMTLSLSGGLSRPGQNVYLHGHPPAVTARGPDDRVLMRLSRSDQTRFGPTSVATRQSHPLPQADAVGDYLIEIWPMGADVNKQSPSARRGFRLGGWDELNLVEPAETFPIQLGGLRWLGARLSEGGA